MPDPRNHRGAHPEDPIAFGEAQVGRLRQATAELSWLLGRGYPAKRSLALVGDRHALRARQRKAVGRCAAGDAEVAARQSRRVPPEAVAARALDIDGYNVLLTVEAALGGGVLLLARDGTLRDMAALSRHYKRVEETRRSVFLLGSFLDARGVGPITWYFDRPISNSGRLRALMLEEAGARRWPWRVELVANPDPILKASRALIATADSAVLDSGRPWLNLARHVVQASVPGAWVVDLS
ncbi:MAG: DUF434 domain-containing protein [Holophagales bacterium]|nr:DUF434 domain-containing protein [Holophagales bacterium]